jgi:hypothetical protein
MLDDGKDPGKDGRACLFKIVGGSGSVVLQAGSHAAQLEWATTLYQAIAIANGGGYLNARATNATRVASGAQVVAHSADADADADAGGGAGGGGVGVHRQH